MRHYKRNYRGKKSQMEIDSKDRVCKAFEEKIDHILPACSILAKEQYMKRHCSVCVPPHFNMRKEVGAK
jgi:hypothetical protein